jgi:hypothetical protein
MPPFFILRVCGRSIDNMLQARIHKQNVVIIYDRLE